jgi:hypothetical protein
LREADPAELRLFAADFGGVRDIAGQSLFEAVRALPDSAEPHRAHRAGMLRWSLELLQLRVSWELLVDEAEAKREVDPAIPERDRREQPDQPYAGPARSYAEALAALVEAPHVTTRETALRRLAELAPPIAAVRRELRARRIEVAARLGLDHPWQLAVDGGAEGLAALATSLLDATEPLAKELRLTGSTGSTDRTASGAARTIDAAFGRDADAGGSWPAVLTSRWLSDSFRALAPRAPKVQRLPRALGGSSFLRAASAWGAALRLAGTARSLPYALARDPYPVEAHVFGGAVALTLGDRAFARRKLGLSRRAADAHARSLARIVFLELRSLAASVVLGAAASVDAGAVEELGVRVFGSPLPRALGEAWAHGGFSGALPVDLPARLVGATRAHTFAQSLVARFDEDWFDNPRAGAHFSAMAAGPVWSGEVPEVQGSATAIARAFEELLG